MIHLDLTPSEQEILREVLKSYLSDLRMEISHTDRSAFKEMLRRRKAVLMKTLEVLDREAAPC